jgi:cytochrome c nitrite reductase small subunit
MRSGFTLLILLGVLLGASTGLGVFTFTYARGGSYLTDDPAACANCHVMTGQFEGWQRASHRAAAVCNDCHTPPGVAGKYSTKAINGFFHSWAFTTGLFPDGIRITARNRRVTESSCLKCHAEIVLAINGTRTHPQTVSCITCHRNVGHEH